MTVSLFVFLFAHELSLSRGPQYEMNLIRGRRVYDSAGPQRLSTQVLTADSTTGISAAESEVAHLTFARTPSTTERAPPLVSSMILKMREKVRPDFLFTGSFGVGGKAVGQLGSVTDYMIRLSPCPIVIVKHWRPVPTLEKEITYLVALDGGEPAFEGLTQVLQTAKTGDKVKCIVIAEDEHGKKTEQRALDIISSTDSLATGDVTHRMISEQSKRSDFPIGTEICSACDDLEADFLVIGTQKLAPGDEDRAAPGRLGSVALYASQHCKCHAIVVKPAVA